MIINENLTENDIDNIVKISAKEYKKYHRDNLEYTIMYIIVGLGLLYFVMSYYFEGYQYLALICILYLCSFSFTINFNRQRLKMKKLCRFISNEYLVTGKAGEYIIDVGEKDITINNSYNVSFKDIAIAFLFQNRIILIDKNNSVLIVKSNFEDRKYVVKKLYDSKVPIFTFDKTNENILLAARTARIDIVIFAISIISWILLVIFLFKFKKMYKLASMAKAALKN